MTENTVEKIVEICKDRGIPVSRLEKDLNLGNGSLNPKKSNDIKSMRLFRILQYLGVSFEEFYGTPVAPLDETKKPATLDGDGEKSDSVDELNDYAFSVFKQLPIEAKISVIGQMQAELQNQQVQDAPEGSA